MTRTTTLWVAAILLGGCVEAPLPWAPDAGDLMDLSPTAEIRRGDNSGEVGPVDMRLVDLRAEFDAETIDTSPEVPCVPDCADKECGPDGCGGECGSCGEFGGCKEDGSCACDYVKCTGSCCLEEEVCFDSACCLRQCEDKDCGEDGCGGECGQCDGLKECGAGGHCECQFEQCGGECCQSDEEVCHEGACCLPDCTGKECGSDGCGGVCSECPEHYACFDEGETAVCEANCDELCAGLECGKAGLGDECDCGNCDDANLCTDDACTPGQSCEHSPNNEPCDDGNPCTGTDTCDIGQCVGELLPLDQLAELDCLCGQDQDCATVENGTVCDGTLYCHKEAEEDTGACAVDPETVLTCLDEHACTDDTCDPVDGCVFVPHDELCDDNNVCTDDICNLDLGCVKVDNDAACSDDSVCTVEDTCAGGACVPGAPLSCGDEFDCTEDACDPVDGCTSTPDDGACDDQNPCTTDVCAIEAGCLFAPDDGNDCSDSDVCNGLEACIDGECMAGVELDCDDASACTQDFCDSALGCQYENVQCDDNDACTADSCGPLKGCVHMDVDCDDANPCTDDSCDATDGCSNQPFDDDTPCSEDPHWVCFEAECTCVPDCLGTECGDDGCGGSCGECGDENPCNGTETCDSGTCLVGELVDCSNVAQCIKPECNPVTGLCDLPVDGGAQCDDGDSCTVDDLCGGGQCQSGKALMCDDANECTEDTCVPESGCMYLPTQDGLLCDADEGECIAGGCLPLPLSCGDVVCPQPEGYDIVCNAKEHCEYERAGQTEAWHEWDVWVFVPPGNFMMGSPDDEPGHYPDEGPVHEVTFSEGYFIGKYEVLTEQYEACVEEGRCAEPSTVDWEAHGWGTNTVALGRFNHPQNGLSRQQSEHFCAWVSPGGRIPTEAEWEFAASGPEHRKYPWGDGPEPTCDNETAVFDDVLGGTGKPWSCNECELAGCSGTWAVGNKGAGVSHSGAFDMAGNVMEWCRDSYLSDYVGAPVDGSAVTKLTPSGQGVLRGGNFTYAKGELRSSARFYDPPASQNAGFGARCVKPLVTPFNCGGTVCPQMDGYDVTCNQQGHCEYANPDQDGANKWDVWIYVPPGSFEMGSPDDEPGHQSNEAPVHTVTLAQGYMVAKYEATVAQYEACISAGDCTDGSTADWDGAGWGLNTSVKGRSDHPQNGLQWQQAKDFCAWNAPGGRLPSEAECEFAVTGPVHRTYPWGDAPAPTCDNDTVVFNQTGNTPGYGCGTGGTWPVGSKMAGASWAGALDMTGNVWEWSEDWYHSSYVGAPADGTAWVDSVGTHRSIRGGSFFYGATSVRSATRGSATPTASQVHHGARCVRPAPATECDGVVCPKLDGYLATCNRQGKCEYYNLDTTAHKRWDVWIYVPPGSFEMGSPEDEEGHHANESPVHPVAIDYGYFLAKYEVVVVQYEACTAANPEECTAADTTDQPWYGWGTNTSANNRSEHPQNGLKWQQARDFCAWVVPAGRLPSEAEWEYAATGPVHRKYVWGDSPEPTCANDTAVFHEDGGVEEYGCGQKGTWKVGSKSAGASWSGALDMSGNVWEWNEDWYHGSYDSDNDGSVDAPGDGSAWVEPPGSGRVFRGGSFVYEAGKLRSAERDYTLPGYRSADIGARCLRPLP